jgi:DNA-binding response OmpR family regulator
MGNNERIKYDGLTALIVDDDIDFLEQNKFGLESLGFNVVAAESQKGGETIIENENYDLALFDLMMENEDSGFVLSYKSKKKHPDVPVIIATSVTNETGMQFDAVTEESRSWVKADILLDKDLRFEQLERAVNTLLNKGE